MYKPPDFDISSDETQNTVMGLLLKLQQLGPFPAEIMESQSLDPNYTLHNLDKSLGNNANFKGCNIM